MHQGWVLYTCFAVHLIITTQARQPDRVHILHTGSILTTTTTIPCVFQVGPNATDMVNFRTVVATPAGWGWLRDSSDKLQLEPEVSEPPGQHEEVCRWSQR